jgi:hypothetical protein
VTGNLLRISFPFTLTLAIIAAACAPIPQESAIPSAVGKNVAGVGHFWTESYEFLAPCPEVRPDCVGDLLQPGMGFTVIGGTVDRVVRAGSSTTKMSRDR